MDELAASLDAAASPAALPPLAERIAERVPLRLAQGAPVDAIAAEVSALHRRLIARVWALVAPPPLVADSCLVVMGSEGRGEQILKTDQDNALVLREGAAGEGAEAAARRFSGALADCGWPPCPGGIMVTNPLWRQPVSGFRATIRDWLLGADPEGPMRLAIFCDAAPVAGDAALLAELRDFLDALAADNDAYLARFAAAADQFGEPGPWWTRLGAWRDEQPLDLKKLGIFPVVHGVRTLALQHHVHELGTAARLARLTTLGAVDGTLAGDLLGALRVLMATRLAHQLRQRAAGHAPGNELRPSTLAVPERAALRQALSVVKRWRAWLRQHFRLDTL